MGAGVRAADPHVDELAELAPGVVRADATPAVLAAADAVVLLTDHDAFDAGQIREHARYVLDCRRMLPPGGNVETL